MNRKNTYDLHLDAKKIEVELQELKGKILKEMNDKLKKGENVDHLQKRVQQVDEQISRAINIYHVEED